MPFVSRIKSLVNYMAGKGGAGKAFRLVVEITNDCNLKCVMCPRNCMKRPVAYMEKEMFRRIIAENRKSLEFVSLNGYGEPLMHPGLFDYIDVCRQNKVPVGISTNCTLLSPAMSREILERGPNQITLAVDSVEKKGYEKVRRGAKFETVMENVAKFLEMRKSTRRDIFIVLQCIYMTETKEQIQQFRDRFKGLPYDAIRIRQLTYSGAWRKDGPYRNRKCPCYWLWTEPMILCDGTVVACCQDINADLRIGDVSGKSLDEIWNGGQVSEIRSKHSRGNRNLISICRDCNMYQPGIPISICASGFNTRILNKMLPYIETLISKRRYG